MSDAAALDALTALAWLRDVGADDAVLEAPVDRYAAAPAPLAERPAERPAARAAAEPRREAPRPASDRPAYESGTARQIDAALRPAAALDRSADLQSARALAEAATTLAELRSALERFEGCLPRLILIHHQQYITDGIYQRFIKARAHQHHLPGHIFRIGDDPQFGLRLFWQTLEGDIINHTSLNNTTDHPLNRRVIRCAKNIANLTFRYGCFGTGNFGRIKPFLNQI